jgi:ABC-type spermidine/putrescine transport system, permease component I
MKGLRWLPLPALIWFGLFIAVPLLLVFVVSFATRGTYGGVEWTWTFDNYIKIFSSSYVLIFFESIKLATVTTVGCAVIGVFVAWAMATATPSRRYLYLCLLALPFLTNLIIRIYALRVFLGYEGPVQSVLTMLGIPFDPFAFSQGQSLVLYGMITTYLPFMIFPLYGAFEKFDFNLVEAAQDLGAGPWKCLFSVILPNLKRPLINGSVLVFIPAMGEYVIPDLLGGAKTMLFGNLITERFLKSRDWPQGAALSVLLIAVLLLVVFISMRTERKGE